MIDPSLEQESKNLVRNGEEMNALHYEHNGHELRNRDSDYNNCRSTASQPWSDGASEEHTYQARRPM